jgi:hypothetical protein
VIGLLKILLPLLCIAASTWLVYDGQAQLAQAQEVHRVARESLNMTRKAYEGFNRTGTKNIILSLPESSEEEARFLTGLRKHAAAQGATVLKWSSTAEPYAEDPRDPDRRALKGLTRVSTHVTAVGSYPSLYRFLQSLSSSSRFYTFSEVRWTTESGRNRVSFTITRFVEPSENSS